MFRVIYLVVLATFCSCNFSEKETDDFSSPKNLFVDHISAHTGGVISVGSPVRIRFTRNVSDSTPGNRQLEDILRFSPSIKGKATWEDSRTLLFTPSALLPANQRFEATLQLESIFPDLPKEKREFNFVFQTLAQNYDITLTGLRIENVADLSKMNLHGFIQTADVTNTEQLKNVISANYNASSLPIQWGEAGMSNTLSFVVEDVIRKNSQGKIILKTSGASIGVEKEESVVIDIPALGDYKVTSSQVNRGAENYISVFFSDPLDPRQNLNGLVTLANSTSAPRMVINLNELKIYPTEELTSDVDLTIHKALKNVNGIDLKEKYQTTIRFIPSKPEVRLSSSGTASILPNANELVLPFEAIGLKAVDVTIIRIFEDNMLQYLQVNALGGENELSRVGQPVITKTLPLNTSGITNLNTWNTFTLDLGELFNSEPGAFYQVKIGFQREHSLYACANDEPLASLNDIEVPNDYEDESSWWDEYYYSPDFNWEERDNPCSNSYYGGRRTVSKMLMSSDFGIIAKRRDAGDLFVFVSSLLNTQPVAGADIEIYDYQQQRIATAKTDNEGNATIPLRKQPFTLVVKKNKQTGYLKLNDGSALSLSNFNVTGQVIQKGLKGFIYGERGVWRPADTVHLAFILEDMEKSLPSGHPVILEMINPAGQLGYRQVKSEGVGNIYRFDVVTDRDSPTGNWRARVKAGGATFYKNVKIETIKPNRLKVELSFDKKKFNASDKNITGDLNVRWLSGATASNLKAEYEMLLTPVKTSFDAFPNYSFDDHSKAYSSERTLAYEGRVDGNGQARVSIDLGESDEVPGALTVNLFGKVYEEGGDFSISITSIPYYPYEHFVGLKVPEGDKRGMLLTDKDHIVRIASVDADGKPVSRQGLEVELYKVEWKWWWDNTYDNISNYVGRSYGDPVAQGTLNTINGEGSYTLRVDQPAWGRYYLRVKDPVSGHSAGQVIYLDWPGWAGKGRRGELDGATMLDFSVEKEEYVVGDEISISIPSTKGNRLLVSLETGSSILKSYWVETKDEITEISFEATSNMAPNIYTHLTMLQPHGQTVNDLPIRLYGVKSLKVVDKETALKPVIQMPQALRPEEEFTVQVSETSGKPMSYTLAIVDEGLLDITNFKTPAPWEVFYAREALGIKTWDVYDDVMGTFAGKMEHLLAVGGDGEILPKEENEANRFKPVVKYLGPFLLKKGEKKKHVIRMPQYIGSIKTMVVAAYDGAYGHADATTPVKQPLMVLATLPRVAGPGESMKLPVNIFALEDNVGDITVTVETSGTLESDGPKSLKTNILKSGDKVVYFDIKALPKPGVGKVKVTAKSGRTVATYDIEMNVIPRNPVVTDVSDKVLGQGKSWTYAYSPIGMLGENEASVEISSLPPLNIEKRLKYLVQYPHGCLEQTVSAVFAQLFVGQLMPLTPEQEKEIQTNISAAIQRLSTFQLSSGGFVYWPGNEFHHSWGTTYTGHFLLEARAAGYSVPESMISSWISFQTGRAEAWSTQSSDTNDDLVQAYRLYSLALAGKPALGAMNRMKENSQLHRAALWRLASAYAVAGYVDQAKKMTENITSTADHSPQSYRQTFGSEIRDQAMILETLLAINKKEQAFGLMLDLAREMGDQEQWMSTQTTAYCFIAISKYVRDFTLDNATHASVGLDGREETFNNREFVNQLSLENADKSTSLNITNKGESPVYVRIIRSGIPLEGNDLVTERNIGLSVAYQDMDGNALTVSKLRQGTNFKAIVTVTNPGQKGDYEELALTQIFPSGWEIINTRLNDTAQADNRIEYMDIRDDRVMHYFDLTATKSISFEVLLNASYRGTYYLPSISVGAMYDNAIFANTPGNWVEIVNE